MSSGQQRLDDVPLLVGGISQQPPHVRLRNQVEDATNVAFSVSDGPRMRAGTAYVAKVTGLTAAGNYRLHGIERDASEKYNVVYGASVLQVISAAGTAANVQKTADATVYLASQSPTADDYRLTTVADYTIIANNNVPVASLTSPTYSVTDQHDTYEDLLAHTPAVDSYHATNADSVSATRGYWQYKPSSGTYATIAFNTIGSSWDTVAEYTGGSAATKQGFKIMFSRVPTAATNASWTVATKRITKTGAFTNYTWQAGDRINITGGTGATGGYYEVVDKVSADAITLATGTGLSGSNQTDYAFDGVGQAPEVIVDNGELQPETMYAVARNFQKAMRDAGAVNACCEFQARDSATTHRMVITHSHSGSQCTFPATAPTRSPSATVADLSNNANDPFYGGGSFTVTAGTGPVVPATQSAIDRWVRRPAPSQGTAQPDPISMPSRLVRIHAGGVYSTGYEGMTNDFAPVAYWRLGEASGTTAYEETGLYPGTYVNAPTYSATGAINGDSDTAITFNGTDEYMTASGLGDFGSKCHRGFTFECWVSRASNTRGVLCYAYGGGATAGFIYFTLAINSADLGATSTTGAISAQIETSAASGSTGLLLGVVNSAALASTATFYHLVVTVSESTVGAGLDTMAIYVNGVAQTVTNSGGNTPITSGDVFNFTGVSLAAAYNGSTAATFLACTLDEVAFFRSVWTAATVGYRYNQGINASYSHPVHFLCDAIQWNFRETGDELTNPLPALFRHGHTIDDVAFMRDRLVLAGGESLLFSQAGDYFNFYLANDTNIVDSDPIDAPINDDRVAFIDWIVPWRDSLMVFTKAGRQFEMSSPDVLTPTSVAFTVVSSYQTQSVKPETLGGLLYFATAQANPGLYEMQFNELQLKTNAEWVSGHAPSLLPQNLRRLAGSSNTNTLIVLADDSDGHECFSYQTYWSGDERQQSAWGRVAFLAAYRIADVSVLGETAYFLVEHQSQYFIESLLLANPEADSGWAYAVHADRRFTLTGVHAAGTTTWTLPNSASDTTLNTIVLGPAFGASSGNVHTPTATPGTTVTLTGDYSAGSVQIGRAVTESLTLTRPFWRDLNGSPDLGARVTLRETVVVHRNSGPYTITSAMQGRTNRTKTFTPPTGTLISTNGTTRAFLNGNAADNVITITATGPRPVIIAGVQQAYDSTSRAPD